ncbi:MAG: single-stranded DNA-binding protein, partial [Lactobacillus sp.]|nr:single-stranded DNA-binding protein [Lactobacillus sp.]
MINNVTLVGRLTADANIKKIKDDNSVATFTLAVDRSYTNANGQRETDFIHCVIWRKSADNFAKFTSKGKLVGVEGRIQTRNYENENHQRVYVTEVLVKDFSLLEKKETAQSNNNQPHYANDFSQAASPNNQQQQTNNPAPTGNTGQQQQTNNPAPAGNT